MTEGSEVVEIACQLSCIPACPLDTLFRSRSESNKRILPDPSRNTVEGCRMRTEALLVRSANFFGRQSLIRE
jgi:hypothetical protein